MNALDGYKTYITAGVVVIFAIARVMGIDLGMNESQFEAAIIGLIGVALAFLRKGVSSNGTGT